MSLTDAANRVAQQPSGLTYDQVQEYRDALFESLGALTERHREWLKADKRGGGHEISLLALDHQNSDGGKMMSVRFSGPQAQSILFRTVSGFYDTENVHVAKIMPDWGADSEDRKFSFDETDRLEEAIVGWIRDNAHYSVTREFFKGGGPKPDLDGAAARVPG